MRRRIHARRKIHVRRRIHVRRKIQAVRFRVYFVAESLGFRV
jgi:hypothetical protein